MKNYLCTALFVLLGLQPTIVVIGQSMPPGNPDLQTADSLYFAQDYRHAYAAYKNVLEDTIHNAIAWNRLGYAAYHSAEYEDAMRAYEKALSLTTQPSLKASVYSRMAMVYAARNEKAPAITAIDSAFSAGYMNITELDSLKAFNSIRNEPAFINLRNKVYGAAYPCMGNAHAREFDFWAGEWNVYATGTPQLVGHSIVQIVAGGCALLESWDSPVSTGKSINFIDPVTNKWKQSWAGSYAGGIQEFTNGEYKDSAMRFEFTASNTQGKTTIGRFVFYNLAPGKVRQFSESSDDGGKTWTTNYDFTYIRKQ